MKIHPPALRYGVTESGGDLPVPKKLRLFGRHAYGVGFALLEFGVIAEHFAEVSFGPFA